MPSALARPRIHRTSRSDGWMTSAAYKVPSGPSPKVGHRSSTSTSRVSGSHSGRERQSCSRLVGHEVRFRCRSSRRQRRPGLSGKGPSYSSTITPLRDAPVARTSAAFGRFEEIGSARGASEGDGVLGTSAAMAWRTNGGPGDRRRRLDAGPLADATAPDAHHANTLQIAEPTHLVAAVDWYVADVLPFTEDTGPARGAPPE